MAGIDKVVVTNMGALKAKYGAGVMLQRDDRYLSLALPESAPPAGTPATAASETEQVQLQGV